MQSVRQQEGQGEALFHPTNPMPDNHPAPPADPNAPQLRPHIYDGIQENDQKLPNWWLYTFYFAIVWFLIYWVLYYQAGMFMTDHEQLVDDMAQIQAVKAKELESMMAKLDDNVLWEWSANSQITGEGKAIYDKFCFTCHAPDLTAMLNGVKLPGLSLVDKEWKYGGAPMTLYKLISKGSPDKTQAVQMPPWEQQLSPAEVGKVLAFVLSHHEKPAAEPPAAK